MPRAKPLSNRQRQMQARAQPAPARRAPLASPSPVAAEKPERPADRDGLLWLIQRNRLTQRQVREAKAYRADFRDVAAAGATVKSCLDVREGGRGAQATDGPTSKIIHAVDSQRRLFVKRWVALKGQAALLDVLDSVCGHGLTLRELSGGRTPQAMVLEQALKIALDLLVTAHDEGVANSTESRHVRARAGSCA